MIGKFDMSEEQTKQMKEKTFRGIFNLIASRCKDYDNGIFKIVPDRENPSEGLPVVTFVGMRDGVFYPSEKWETWRDIILLANEAGLNLTERMAQKAVLSYMSKAEKESIYSMVDKSGMDANAGMVEATNESQAIVCISEQKDSVSFYIANLDEDGLPLSFEGDKLDII